MPLTIGSWKVSLGVCKAWRPSRHQCNGLSTEPAIDLTTTRSWRSIYYEYTASVASCRALAYPRSLSQRQYVDTPAASLEPYSTRRTHSWEREDFRYLNTCTYVLLVYKHEYTVVPTCGSPGIKQANHPTGVTFPQAQGYCCVRYRVQIFRATGNAATLVGLSSPYEGFQVIICTTATSLRDLSTRHAYIFTPL